MGDASKVVPIDKLSVVITLVLAFIVLHEEFTTKSVIGCILIGAGTLLMVLQHKFQFVEPLMKQDHGNNRAVSEVYPEKPDIPHFQMVAELTSVSSSSSSSSR